MNLIRAPWIALAACVGTALFLYRAVIFKLVYDWSVDDNYSHGFLIVPLALYFAWERRDRVTAPKPSAFGLVIVLASLGMLLAGLLGAELFLTRVSIIGVLAGGLVFVRGWRDLRTFAFPLAFLILMIPIPAIVFNQIAFPLQILASRMAEVTLETLRIPVLREGNVIFLANTTLEVAEACSGIRSLISLLTLGIVYGYFMDSRPTLRIAVAASTVPIAIIANACRVAGTGIAAHHLGPQSAEGFFHMFSGWLVFGFAFVMLFAVAGALKHWLPAPAPAPALPPVEAAA